MSSTPIRQPRGPTPDSSFGTSTSSPPEADTGSHLRRNKSTSTSSTSTTFSSRHQGSASISTPASSLAFHGRGFRSGSLSSGSDLDIGNGPGVGVGVGVGVGGLVRKGSGRDVKKSVVVEENLEENMLDPAASTAGSWGKGLSRQSSLPSRRGLSTSTINHPPVPPLPTMLPPPPPRPPRRISVDITDKIPSPPISAHSASHSMSSLTMFNQPQVDEYRNIPASVSRAQSLRAQAKVHEPGLGRSSSLRMSGETYRSPALSPPTQNHSPYQDSSPRNPFTPPTPPPVTSTAALPPFQLPNSTSDPLSDLKRHQSLTQGYGSSNRVKDRLERSPALLSLEQREEIARRQDVGGGGLTHSRTVSEDIPPTSPIGRSVWTPTQTTTSWIQPTYRQQQQQLQDAFDAMNLGRQMMEDPNSGAGGGVRGDIPVQTADEPSWVANLVGLPDRRSPHPPRPTLPASWIERDQNKTPTYSQPRYDPQHQVSHFQTMQQPQAQVYQHQQGNLGLNIQNPYMSQLGYLQQQQQQQQQQQMMGMYNPNMTKQLDMQYQYGYPNQGYMPPFPVQQVPQHPGQGGRAGTGGQNGFTSPPVTAVPGRGDVDIVALARSKGLNPATFDCKPAAARFFVIKSYTEEDVQKSLKHEIWSSTVLGNKRLDTAFKESADKLPIYLFFSVNGSRHFCGVAQMLTAVDENQTSTVWAQDKWKGIFKVKWIFVRDVPTAALRHIRLLNTPEQKPITNSRDTQELHYEAGTEVLQIFLDHQTKSKTSLLQDFAYYEQLAANRAVQPTIPGAGLQRPPTPTNKAYNLGRPVMGNVPPVPPIPSV